MKPLANAKRWRDVFWIALGLFIVTRLLTLMVFPIFNDEAIYVQYSQAIHDDWQKSKYISMNGEGQWINNVEQEMCETRVEIRAYPAQTPISVCKF
jgi:hypothetical protein